MYFAAICRGGQLRPPVMLFLCLFGSLTAAAQKGYFEEREVSSFDPPFGVIVVDVYGEEQEFHLTDKTKLKGQKGKKLEPGQIEEGTLLTKIEYELEGDKLVVTSIDADVSADGSIRVAGLFEGVQENGLAFIDGYPVKLMPGTAIEGDKSLLNKKKCDCAGMVVTDFGHPLLKEGGYYVSIRGIKDDQGVISASKATLCRNTFGPAEQAMLAAVDSNFVDGTARIADVPADVFTPAMGLYDGQIQVGMYSYTLADDIALQGYVNQVGNRLIPVHAAESGSDGSVSYRFYAIEDEVPNAFAFPTGMIFISTGLLDIIDNEAQLAIVLAHEIAHVTHEHGRERFDNVGLVKTAGTITSLVGETFADQLAKEYPDVPASLVGPVSQLSQAITPQAISNILKPQAKMESQADRVGLLYAYQAGYDVREAASFWNKMRELTGETSWQSEIAGKFVGTLSSDRYQLAADLGVDTGTLLTEAAKEVLTKEVLDTIYLSHPKSEKRARSVGKLVDTVYGTTDWADYKVDADRYLARTGR